MKDLHEGILIEFAERASRSLELEAFTTHGLHVIDGVKADGMKELRQSRKAKSLCQQCGTPAVATLCVRHAAARSRARAARSHVRVAA